LPTIASFSQSCFSVFNLDDTDWPVLVTVPHAGRDYPEELMENLRIDPSQLILFEDRRAELLAQECIARGIAVVVARRPRAWLDLNRGAAEIDADIVEDLEWKDLPHVSNKVRGGLGLIPRRLGAINNVWRRPWPRAALDARIADYHQPYHDAVSAMLARIRQQHGGALLMDLHSMPPLRPAFGRPAPRLVIGDLFGRSAQGRMTQAVMSAAQQGGLTAALNHPYAGGYTVQAHHDLSANIHAIQLEVDRSLYLCPDLLEAGEGVAAMARHVAELAMAAAAELTRPFWPLAAE